ncbi:MAG: tetrathionate reductase family octaheme c-type cytochrome [Bacteroidales bacterium]|nr:tetrathionate reductase family octaheme c-type cytochrome [Bacteroidales bacterium]
MKKAGELVLILVIPWVIIFYLIWTVNSDKDPEYYGVANIQVEKKNPVTDHSKFAALQKPFNNPSEVTEACLGCHNGRDAEIMKTEHWRWLKKDSIPGRGVMDLGKKNIINNFCIGVNSNEKLCMMCHAGYGWGDKTFDFHNSNNIDCLVCHDNTGTYKKSKPGTGPMTGSGFPKSSVNLNNVAQHVGYPHKNNCGACHFTGGGGNNVKHGDLEQVLNHCTRAVDVHMNADGKNMDCTECHKTKNHQVSGQLYTVSSSNSNRATCVQCHTDKPHKSKLLNEHYELVACQTCHIPTYAKVNPTKVYWDWSTAGKLKDGKPYMEESEDKTHEYDSKHGDAVFAAKIQPEYVWFNGTADHHLIEDKIDTFPLELNHLNGSYDDNLHPENPKNVSRIWPVKIMRGKQIYDTERKTLIQPKLVGKKGSGAFWADFDWQASANAGMKYLGLPYSGMYGFVETESYWPVNHMVSPASEALQCADCHSRQGRLENLAGFYLPGRDLHRFMDKAGLLFILLVSAGVLIHGFLRVVSSRKQG